jgi:hypothetical protein
MVSASIKSMRAGRAADAAGCRNETFSMSLRRELRPRDSSQLSQRFPAAWIQFPRRTILRPDILELLSHIDTLSRPPVNISALCLPDLRAPKTQATDVPPQNIRHVIWLVETQ